MIYRFRYFFLSVLRVWFRRSDLSIKIRMYQEMMNLSSSAKKMIGIGCEYPNLSMKSYRIRHGICGNVYDFMGYPSDDIKNRTFGYLRDYFETWPYYSGNPSFPIPVSAKNIDAYRKFKIRYSVNTVSKFSLAMDYFHNCENKLEGVYGQNRILLMGHIINCLKTDIKKELDLRGLGGVVLPY